MPAKSEVLTSFVTNSKVSCPRCLEPGLVNRLDPEMRALTTVSQWWQKSIFLLLWDYNWLFIVCGVKFDQCSKIQWIQISSYCINTKKQAMRRRNSSNLVTVTKKPNSYVVFSVAVINYVLECPLICACMQIVLFPLQLVLVSHWKPGFGVALNSSRLWYCSFFPF